MLPNPEIRTAPKLEICIDSPASARAAGDGGADRVELCANLPDGGTTPSLGTVRAVRRIFDGGLMVIIRPRGGDFLFDPDEIAAMLEDIRAARQAGADGVVIGCLTAEGAVDSDLCARLLDGGLHRRTRIQTECRQSRKNPRRPPGARLRRVIGACRAGAP